MAKSASAAFDQLPKSITAYRVQEFLNRGESQECAFIPSVQLVKNNRCNRSAWPGRANVIPRLNLSKYTQVVAMGKHSKNIAIRRELHPKTRIIMADLAVEGAWDHETVGRSIWILVRKVIRSRGNPFVVPRNLPIASNG